MPLSRDKPGYGTNDALPQTRPQNDPSLDPAALRSVGITPARRLGSPPAFSGRDGSSYARYPWRDLGGVWDGNLGESGTERGESGTESGNLGESGTDEAFSSSR